MSFRNRIMHAGLVLLSGGLLLVGAQSAAHAQEPIKIGFFGPITERFAGLGLDAKKGADLAVKQANAAGGVNGRKIELVAYDDRGNRTEAVAVARKLIEQDKVFAIVSGSLSLTSIAAAPIISEAKVPMVAAYSNAVGVVKGNDYVFRWASVADVQGWVMGHHAVQRTRLQALRAADAGRGIRPRDHQRRRKGAREARRKGRLQEGISAQRTRIPRDDDRDQESQCRCGDDERPRSAAHRSRPARLRARRVSESAVLRRAATSTRSIGTRASASTATARSEHSSSSPRRIIPSPRRSWPPTRRNTTRPSSRTRPA